MKKTEGISNLQAVIKTGFGKLLQINIAHW